MFIRRKIARSLNNRRAPSVVVTIVLVGEENETYKIVVSGHEIDRSGDRGAHHPPLITFVGSGGAKNQIGGHPISGECFGKFLRRTLIGSPKGEIDDAFLRQIHAIRCNIGPQLCVPSLQLNEPAP